MNNDNDNSTVNHNDPQLVVATEGFRIICQYLVIFLAR